VVSAALAEEVTHDPARVRERAAELLSRPPYREEPEGLLERLVGTVREWLADVLDTILGAVAADASLAWLVIAAGVAILLVVVWRSTRGLSLDRAVDPPATGDGDGRPASAWHAEAEAHERAGDHAQAVRCRYVALVTALVEEGVVEEVPGRTVGELDRELVGSAPTLAPDVAAAGRIFAEVVYGRAPGTPEQAARLGELARTVAAGAGAGRHVAGAGRGS
jgi:hypothetical protein